MQTADTVESVGGSEGPWLLPPAMGPPLGSGMGNSPKSLALSMSGTEIFTGDVLSLQELGMDLRTAWLP